MDDLPAARTASHTVLYEEYDGAPASTVGYAQAGEVHLVMDPGRAGDRSFIPDSPRTTARAPEPVSDVVFSHHHPEHTLNTALFLIARFHDHRTAYSADRRLLRTPRAKRASDLLTQGSVRIGAAIPW
ncbi:hypothetical protein GCM10023334_103580 [Nonomuraea thailandensis]